MHSEAYIVVYGRDFELLQTRRLVLESPGYQVKVSTEISTTVQSVLEGQVDLVILCHTLTAEDRLAILPTIHSAHPEAQIWRSM